MDSYIAQKMLALVPEAGNIAPWLSSETDPEPACACHIPAHYIFILRETGVATIRGKNLIALGEKLEA